MKSVNCSCLSRTKHSLRSWFSQRHRVCLYFFLLCTLSLSVRAGEQANGRGRSAMHDAPFGRGRVRRTARASVQSPIPMDFAAFRLAHDFVFYHTRAFHRMHYVQHPHAFVPLYCTVGTLLVVWVQSVLLVSIQFPPSAWRSLHYHLAEFQ